MLHMKTKNRRKKTNKNYEIMCEKKKNIELNKNKCNGRLMGRTKMKDNLYYY